ncbi:hypothetical protein [Paraburkholderia sp. SIMBA_054]|uniref:hypothetical protein n=1 Tax=Paraburkholderia sp. SIMBA_054 TaxID=3085795 RepID=UPI00397B6D95
MKEAERRDDGTAELILLRRILPFSALAWAVAAVMYSSGLVPFEGELAVVALRLLRTLTYVGGFGLALAVACVAIYRPRPIKLGKGWVLMTIAGAVASAGFAVTLISLVSAR